MIQEFSRVYNCHYQLGVSLTAISIDSTDEWFAFRGVCMHIPPFSKRA